VLFMEFLKIKSSPKTGVSQITNYLNINPILTSHNYKQKIIAHMTCFCFHIFINKGAMLKQKFTVQVTTLPDCDDITRFDGRPIRKRYNFPKIYS